MTTKNDGGNDQTPETVLADVDQKMDRAIDAHTMSLAYLLSKIINRSRVNAVAAGAF